MLITFKSAASSDVTMFETNGKDLLKAAGKDPEAPMGVFTVKQLPVAIFAIRAAILEDKAQPVESAHDNQEVEERPDDEVRLFQRAAPLLDMLERSMKDRVPVTWGV